MIHWKNVDEQIKSVAIDDQITSDHLGRLTSYTKKLSDVGKICPLSSFNQAHTTGKNRNFWGEPAADFYILGVGSVYQIDEQENRFHATELAWKDIIEQAITFNDVQKAGTGLVALGGMSFDPLRKTDPAWESFGDSQLNVPEITFTFSQEDVYVTTNVLLAKDHLKQTFTEVHTVQLAKWKAVFTGAEIGQADFKVIKKDEQTVEKWKDSVQLAIDEIKANKAQKIVLSRELQVTLDRPANLGAILQGLIQTQPDSYIFAIERGDSCFVGATPERLVRVEGADLLSTCLAGTAPRGDTETADNQFSEGLLNDPKNLSEHDYVVQMIRDGITPFCSEVNIPKQPTVKTLKNLHHLYTPVTATLKDGYSIFDIVESLHPTPALGGVPREKSLAFIRDHESFDRGWFGAPVGWLDSEGNGEFAVAIRSGLIKQNKASLFAGCGVMADSNIQAEYEETGIKFLPVLNVLEGNYDLS